MTTNADAAKELYMVALTGMFPAKTFYFTADKDLYDRVDSELPEVDRELVEAQFDGFECFSLAADFITRVNGKIVAEKWGYC